MKLSGIKMAKKLTVAVLYGGKSAEHEVSIESARSVCKSLDRDKYEVLPVYIDKAGRWTTPGPALDTKPEKPEIIPSVAGDSIFKIITPGGRILQKKIGAVFPVIHGSYGEDGILQGLLELCGVPYAGCGVLASAIGMDKEICKKLAALEGIPVLEHVALYSPADLKNPLCRGKIKRMGLPLFVKPADSGSSVGVTRVNAERELEKAVKYAFRFTGRVMVEKGIDRAREFVCGVLGEGGRVLTAECGEVALTGKHAFFDYNAKYLDDEAFDFIVPARLPDKTSAGMRKMSETVFRALRGSGMARVDFLMERRTGRFYFCEINTIPGFTSHSLYPKAWEKSGLPLPRLLDRLISSALKNKNK